MNTCTRCRNEWHEGCDGGAWTEDMRPAPCNCWMYGHETWTPKRKQPKAVRHV